MASVLEVVNSKCREQPAAAMQGSKGHIKKLLLLSMGVILHQAGIDIKTDGKTAASLSKRKPQK